MGAREEGDRTNSGRFDHVADSESLDCFIFGGASRAVGASNWLDVTTTLLVPPATR